MKFRYLGGLAALLFFGVLLFGCTGSFSGKDCGTDMKCFNDAAEKCEAAEVTSKASGAEGLMRVWPDGDNCKLYYQVTKVPEGSSEEIAKMEGLDMTCTVPKDEMDSTSISSATSSGEEICEGSLYDYMKEMMSSYYS
ncbi:MAG: hypothetical protein ABIH99_02290 [Candidatus Micrarchaeota archaeon]